MQIEGGWDIGCPIDTWGGLVINRQGHKRQNNWPTNGRTGEGPLGLWDSGKGGRNGRPRNQPERGQGRDFN
jgi:hypothetical protein